MERNSHVSNRRAKNIDNAPEFDWPEGYLPVDGKPEKDTSGASNQSRWSYGDTQEQKAALSVGIHEELSDSLVEAYDIAECDEDENASDAQELGRKGEEVAVLLLERKGYDIVERNWSCFAGEADIIALDHETLVFVEVKTRSGIGKGLPEEAVDRKKRSRYEKIAAHYLSEYSGEDCPVRFDIISILALPNSRALVRHLVNAFGAGE